MDAALAARLYPILMGLTFAAAFGLSLLRPPSLIEVFAALTDPADPEPAARAYMRAVAWVWFGFLLCNAAVATATLWAGPWVWTLYRVPVDGDLVPGQMAGAAARAEDGMTPGSLRTLLADGRDPTTPVTPDRCWERFRTDVTGLSLRLRTQGIRRGALWCKDGYAFAVGIFGMAQAGCAVVLPPHVQPGFLAECGDPWDAMISDDLDGAVPPLAEPAADPMPPPTPPAESNSSPRAPPVGSNGWFVPSTFWNERPPRWKISGADPA